MRSVSPECTQEVAGSSPASSTQKGLQTRDFRVPCGERNEPHTGRGQVLVKEVTNYPGGVADVLQAKAHRWRLGHLDDLALLALYTNDRQIHEVRVARGYRVWRGRVMTRGGICIDMHRHRGLRGAVNRTAACLAPFNAVATRLMPGGRSRAPSLRRLLRRAYSRPPRTTSDFGRATAASRPAQTLSFFELWGGPPTTRLLRYAEGETCAQSRSGGRDALRRET